MIKYPNYDESILSVISSILKYYGYDNGHKSLDVLDDKLKNKYKNIVLMIFDGMGVNIVNKYLKPGDFLHDHFVKTISSVCPSTTACAIPTIESGKSPIEHSWLGWDMYFKDYDNNVSVFRNTFSGSNEKVENCVVADKYIKYYNVFDRIKDMTEGRVHTHDISKYSDTNEFVYSCEEMMQVVSKIAENDDEDFIYTYLEEPDSVMHAVGTDHEYVKENVRYINSLVYELCHMLRDSLVVVMADHGLLDCKTVYLEDYPKLQSFLKRKVSIETRAVNFYVLDGFEEKFKEEFEKQFGDSFILMSKEELIEKNMLGTGVKHEMIDEVIGTYIAFATSDIALEWERDGYEMVARHAGLTQEEMEVPFIMIDTNELEK